MAFVQDNKESPRRYTARAGLFMLSALSAAMAQADVGALLWEEDFDSLNPSVWNVDEGDGCPSLCGWGNQELQWYAKDNLSIEEIPAEPGNHALVIEARRQDVGGKAFTSGKITTKDAVSVRYGMIEIRMQSPEVGVGLWPAAWMLGTSTANWPAKGEIDIMEMGHSAAGRKNAGHDGAPINNYVGSNLIFYADSACVPDNPSCAASTAWNTDNAYVASTPLSNRFVTYRLYWTESQIRFAIVDNGQEHDLYDNPIPIGGEAEEFQAPFYFLLNLAVGGNFTDARENGQVSAPLPGKMLVDYIRVYELDGQGEVKLGRPGPETGTFGVFTDESATTNKLEAGSSSDIYVWDQTTSGGSESPYEGDKVISWKAKANTWFGGGVQARQPVNLSKFDEGELKFRIKIPADVSFRIGVTDTHTNQNWLDFPAYEDKYGLTRNGEWGEVSIPVSELRGPLIDLRSIQYPFAILSKDGQLPGTDFAFAIDDILWTGGGGPVVVDSDNDGVNDNEDMCPGTPAGTPVGADGCPLEQDADGDGVEDSIDQCPNTPAGAEVDEVGCQVIVTDKIKVQAEDYSAFFDTSPGNNGGVYREDDVDIEATSDVDGGYNIGWTDANEWLEYSVTLGHGQYSLDARVASLVGNGKYAVFIDGDLVGSKTVDATGGWQTFVTQEVGSFNVERGQHTLKVEMYGGELNLNWLEIRSMDVIDSDGDGVKDERDQCPGTPAGDEVDDNGCTIVRTENVVVQAEDYDAYFDTTPGNQGGAHRNDDVDIEVSGDVDGGHNVGWIAGSEWLEYNVTLGAGDYDLTARVASAVGGGRFRVLVDGAEVGTGSVANTGGWQSYRTLPIGTFTVDQGEHRVRVEASVGEFNLNWLNILTHSDADSDHDGVADNLDQCPNTPVGTQVDASGCPVGGEGDSVRVMTFNVRTEQANDPGERNWSHRKGEVVRTIQRQNPDLLGLQETTGGQYDFIKNTLGANWGATSYRQILYRSDRYTYVDGGLIDLVADVWGPRSAEWAKMRRNADGRELVFINTHWGVDGNSQQGSANILRDRLGEVNQNWGTPTVLLGDLNAIPGSGPVNTLVNQTPLNSFFSGGTFNNWNVQAGDQLDHVVGSRVNAAGCALETYREGDYPPSDHYPIACELRLQ
ncbi:Beta-glucanase/Beta-glucan synthetase [Hahella chejuensis KCTC 2396]|uniref:Beta-glucanase/Beta-glucan synthetase n=1 Tax=Hahella chejuensis (strain KCTC 2396) TaxID=349521 RepID=Q2SHX0_HAHCH|nr:carbohydrate-binding domain-containing protein [Hahella chejuensis]ABC29754.1 Beta-glucanase/Beta-glucan synthetase [Hahella chejuensis KCTC 2396]